jgi:hypothetical protein
LFEFKRAIIANLDKTETRTGSFRQ